ncbi:transposase [Rhizobium sp. BK661]|nr:transposase [Rhizobium sp. BK661]
MTRPYSNDLRERVIAAVVDGQSCRVVAERFDIAVSSVVKWSQRYRATGSVSPGKMGRLYHVQVIASIAYTK